MQKKSYLLLCLSLLLLLSYGQLFSQESISISETNSTSKSQSESQSINPSSPLSLQAWTQQDLKQLSLEELWTLSMSESEYSENLIQTLRKSLTDSQTQIQQLQLYLQNSQDDCEQLQNTLASTQVQTEQLTTDIAYIIADRDLYKSDFDKEKKKKWIMGGIGLGTGLLSSPFVVEGIRKQSSGLAITGVAILGAGLLSGVLFNLFY